MSKKLEVPVEVFEKIFDDTVKAMVFERLGTLEDRVPTKCLSESEKIQFGYLLLDCIERAVVEFLLTKRKRLDSKALDPTGLSVPRSQVVDRRMTP